MFCIENFLPLDGLRSPRFLDSNDDGSKARRLSFRRGAVALLGLGAVPFLAVLATAAPLRIAARERVELHRDLDQRAGDRRIAAIVLALVGVDVPLLAPREGAQGLVGAAMAALDRDVADVDHPGKVSELVRTSPLPIDS